MSKSEEEALIPVVANAGTRHTMMRFLSYIGGCQMVSVTDTIRAVRREHSILGARDPHLTDMLAGVAVLLDLDVDLNGGAALCGHWSADGLA